MYNRVQQTPEVGAMHVTILQIWLPKSNYYWPQKVVHKMHISVLYVPFLLECMIHHASAYKFPFLVWCSTVK